ncbi:ankyrin repeat, PH and SEC7 domain-containing protein secG [Parachaetomium inaequale]|uniref:Ankyrin repeat, PH and SEC7 domain-containing protein secG n=1 Tax=Parachaetomium inaequale TaxID=2588326 RepID=A0AAN6PKA2_9PEZI|nr:ankyrin repeat, PH and SEC7 domain-containing protein secG [Parachaetomium inaequale]
MAEVGTIVGIISLGIQVADGLVKYYTGYKDRESGTAHTVKRLTHLLSILETLRKHLADRRFQPNEKSLLEAIERSVGDCEDLINELQHETDKFTKAPPAGVVAAARVTGRRLAYPFRQSTLQKLDEDIDEICANLTLALQVLQQQDLGSVQNEIQDTKALLELVRASQVSSEIRDWLKAPDASVNYNEACKKKHPGTGLWFIRSPQFNTWLSTANSFLWLKGFAGCGKSDTSAMVRALILQLVAQLNDQKTLPRLHQSYRGGAPPEQALLDCLHQLVAKFDDVYIILDALDESPRQKHREDVLQALEDMRRWPGPELHFLVTSRDEQDIREYLGPSDDQVVSMKNDLIDADIASFVSGHLKDNRRLRKWEKFHDQIERALTEGAKGVECQFAALEACPGSKTRLDALLGSLPRTLDKTYERMLYSIEEESVDDARRILTLLCTAKRPLRVEELIDGIAVELGDDPKFNEDSRLMNENDIRHICPGFIEVDLKAESNEVTVRIAHYSVQEYLESDRILTSGTARFSVRRAEANTEVASICLAYLVDPGLSEAYINQVEGFHKQYPLAAYAASNWPEHYHEGSCSDPRLHHLALALFHDDQVALVSWANSYKWGGYKRDGLGDRTLSPLYLAARLGLDPVVRVLADETAAARPSKNYFELALIAAATHGHATSVQLLLNHGVAIDYQDFEGTALHTAAKNGHIRVVEALLDGGADIEAQDYRGKTALYDPARMDMDAIVRLLLGRGADVDIVRLLLDRGADPNEGQYRTSLELAVLRGSTEALGPLLRRSAHVNGGRHRWRRPPRTGGM